MIIRVGKVWQPMESRARQKRPRKRPILPRRRPMLSGLKFWYLGNGQMMDRSSSVHMVVKRGTLLSGQTKEWGFTEELPVDLLDESWVYGCTDIFTLVRNAKIPFCCWFGYLYKKEKKGLLWHLNPSYHNLLSLGYSPLVLSTAATKRSCVHDVLRWWATWKFWSTWME